MSSQLVHTYVVCPGVPNGQPAKGSNGSEPAPAPEPEKSPCAKIDAQFGGRWESDPEDKGPREGEELDGADVEGESR